MFPIVFTVLAGSMALASGSLLQPRAAQSPAVCTSDFNWMENAHNDSPCLVAAKVDAICNSGNWIIPALNSSFSYNPPNPSVGTASFCTCSWASYNLISACTACQNSEFASKIVEWTVYSANCAGLLSNTYFPANITLPSGVSIPSWAGHDPTTWTNGLFSAAAAKPIANQGNPDLVQQVTTGKKSTNTGAIVGGVVGGLVVIAAAAAIAFYILRRQRVASNSGPPHSLSDKPHHMRSISDVTTNSGFQQGYTTLSSTPMNPPTSPTIMTHNTSVRSVPYFSSAVGSTVPYGTASPPPGRQRGSPAPANREDIVEPFTSPPSAHQADRKQANGAYPVYDPPSAPPPSAMRMEILRPTTPTPKTRYNPPPYVESTPGGSGSSGTPARPPHRGKQASSDTTHSMTSTGHTQRPTVDHSPNSSASGMANIVGQMGITSPVTPSTQVGGHGRQVSGSKDEKRRPTEESFSARDIA